MKTAEFYRGISLPEEAIELLEKVKDTDEKEMKVLFQNNREVFYKNILKRENPWLSFLYYYSQMACDIWEEYKKRGISEKIYWDTFSDFTIWCQNCKEETGKYGLRQYEWLFRHIDMTLFRLGRLQFEAFPSEWNLTYGEYTVKKGEDVIYVHIPQGAPLAKAECEKSFKEAFSMFGKEKAYICHSWLLGPELSEILGENSNIGKFRSFFHVVLRDYDTREAEERIFKMVQENVSVYPETTSLQRAAKQFLMEGGHLGNGVGILRESCLNCR